MGFFSDVRSATDAARENAGAIAPEPAPRLDTLVTDPFSGEPRLRTDYAGTVWYGGKPQLNSVMVSVGSTAQITTPFWLPDSHAYEPGAVADVRIQATAALQSSFASSSGGSFRILEVGAALAEDPQGTGALRVFMGVQAAANVPLGVAYRVTVICVPEAVRRAG